MKAALFLSAFLAACGGGSPDPQAVEAPTAPIDACAIHSPTPGTAGILMVRCGADCELCR